MNSFNALIIDDESLAQFTLKNKLSDYSNINIVGTAASVKEGVEKIKELKHIWPMKIWRFIEQENMLVCI